MANISIRPSVDPKSDDTASVDCRLDDTPSVHRRSDDTTFGAGTFSWQDPVQS